MGIAMNLCEFETSPFNSKELSYMKFINYTIFPKIKHQNLIVFEKTKVSFRATEMSVFFEIDICYIFQPVFFLNFYLCNFFSLFICVTSSKKFVDDLCFWLCRLSICLLGIFGSISIIEYSWVRLLNVNEFKRFFWQTSKQKTKKYDKKNSDFADNFFGIPQHDLKTIN